jgi:hypothetical protein
MITIYLVKEAYFEDDGGLGGGGYFSEPELLKAFKKKSSANKFLKERKKKLINTISRSPPPNWENMSDAHKLWKFKFTVQPLKVY